MDMATTLKYDSRVSVQVVPEITKKTRKPRIYANPSTVTDCLSSGQVDHKKEGLTNASVTKKYA